MPDFQLTPEQNIISEFGLTGKVFLSGLTGCGKTTAAVARLENLLIKGAPADSIMVLVPQRTLAKPYYNFFNSSQYVYRNEPSVLTLGGLARRMVDLFWPLFATDAGFSSNSPSPSFLTIETAQYFLTHVMEPLFAKGYFSGINIDHNRLAGQILDNLNKAAIIGFPLEEIGTRLRDGNPQDTGLWTAFQQTEECALLFREYCLDHNLLDYSLQMEVFLKHLSPSAHFQKYIQNKFRHLIYDNIEEDVPATHDWIRAWAAHLDSVLLVYDEEGGYRTFLGADPESGKGLASICDDKFHFQEQFTSTPGLQELKKMLQENVLLRSKTNPPGRIFEQFTFKQSHFFPEMIGEVCEEIHKLVKEQGEPAGQMAILAPYVSDSLLFSLTTRLADFQIQTHSARPSRAFIREPVIKCLVTFAKLANPWLEIPVQEIELRQALMTAIPEMDASRARLCCQALFNERKIDYGLGSFKDLKGELPERITYLFGEKLERIRTWIVDYKDEYKTGEILPLFGFWSRLFGELLSQPGLGFHQDFNAAELSSRVILSAKRFRQLMSSLPDFNDHACDREFLNMLQSGLIGGQFFDFEDKDEPEAVFIAPAFTFLMTNRAVKYQFWLDIGSSGWWERLNQPLTHPYVLNRHWEIGKPWQDGDEIKANQSTLARLVGGLLNRCNQHLYLYMAGMDDQGQEQRNQLLQSINLIYRRAVKDREGTHV